MKTVLVLVLIYLISCGTSATLPIPMVGAISPAGPTEVCVSRILEAGLFKLPQLINSPKPVSFSKMTNQVVAGILYAYDYVGSDFKARIVGVCSSVKGSLIATLVEASYVKVPKVPIKQP